MKTIEIKMEAKKAMKVIDLNIQANQKLSGIIDEYIGFVDSNVPNEFWNEFGIGIATTHSQFADVVGFEVYKGGRTMYCCTGSGYHYGGDFNCWVEGSDFLEMLDFAKRIPDLIEGGLETMAANTKKSEEAAKEAEQAIDKLKSKF